MSLWLENVIWAVGTGVVVALLLFGWAKLRASVRRRSSNPATDEQREQHGLDTEAAGDADRIRAQMQANESAARSAVSNRPPLP